MSKFSNMLSSKELALIDDIAKCLVLESYLDFKIPKINWCKISEFILCDEQVVSDIIKQNYVSSYQKIWHELCKCLNVEKLLKYVPNLDYLEKQVLSYLKIIQPDFPVLVRESFRYKCLPRQLKLIANRDFEKNVKIYDVSSFNAKLNSSEELDLKERGVELSIMYLDERQKNPSLLLGPVALVNHDCSANCSYIKDKEGKVCIRTNQKIKQGEELTCYYSKNYFGTKNVDCECETCEKCLRGSYGQAQKQIEVQDLAKYDNFVTNTIKFKKSVENITSDNLYTEAKFQRRQNNTTNNSLMHNNLLYSKFIRFLKSSSMIKDFKASLRFTENEIWKIVMATYKNDHVSSFRAVEKFINTYQETIIRDVTDYTENSEIVAPEHKNMKNYFYRLLQICIQLCPEDAALCIYKGEKLSFENKKVILQKLLYGHTPTSRDKTKLDNTLNKYKIYLQRLSQDFINTVLKTKMLMDIKERNVSLIIPRLLTEEINQYNLSSLEVTTESLNVSSEFDSSLPFTDEEIKEIIGV